MKLQSEGRRAIQDPQATDVHVAVSELALPARSFLILSRAPTSFVQIAMQPRERFVAEYREGGPSIFRSVRADLSRDEIAQLLDSYLAGSDAWRTGLQWRPLERPRDAWDTAASVCMVAALALFIAAGLSLRSPKRAGTTATDPMDYLLVGSLLMLTSSTIDMRRFKEMDGTTKVRTISALFIAVMIIVFYLLER